MLERTKGRGVPLEDAKEGVKEGVRTTEKFQVGWIDPKVKQNGNSIS